MKIIIPKLSTEGSCNWDCLLFRMADKDCRVGDKRGTVCGYFPGPDCPGPGECEITQTPIEDPSDEDDYEGECDDCTPCQGKTYDNHDCNRFVCDMKTADLEVEHYHGRFFWEGPAVRVDNIQDAVSHTKIQCQWDNMGLGYIVYPKQSGKKIVKED